MQVPAAAARDLKVVRAPPDSGGRSIRRALIPVTLLTVVVADDMGLRRCYALQVAIVKGETSKRRPRRLAEAIHSLLPWSATVHARLMRGVWQLARKEGRRCRVGGSVER